MKKNMQLKNDKNLTNTERNELLNEIKIPNEEIKKI